MRTSSFSFKMENIYVLSVWFLCLLAVNSAIAADECPPKFPQGSNQKPVFTVGDIAELKCDVSSRNASKHTLLWKRGNDVLSQDVAVPAKYRNKFNVSLEANVYTLRFKVEENDSGKYNCSCLAAGVQFHVWVKIPCNNCSFVTSVSSSEIARTCKGARVLIIKDNDQQDRFSVDMNCGCTYPAATREFAWRWKFQKTIHAPLSIATNLGKTISIIQPNLKPTGCYTGTNGVTYRYRNITTKYIGTFQCQYDMDFGLYSLYVDDETGTGAEPVYKACCQDGQPECPIAPLIICFIVSGVIDFIGIIVIIYAIYAWRRQIIDRIPSEQWKGFHYILITIGIVELAVLISLIAVAISQENGAYTLHMIKNCESVKCKDALDAGLVMGVIILCLISCLLIGLVVWQIYYRLKTHKDYKINKEEGTSADSNVVLTDTGQEMRNPGNGSHMSVTSGTTNTTERTEFGLREFGTAEPPSIEDNRKKDSISEDEGVHVGGEVPSVGDYANVSYAEPPVRV